MRTPRPGRFEFTFFHAKPRSLAESGSKASSQVRAAPSCGHIRVASKQNSRTHQAAWIFNGETRSFTLGLLQAQKGPPEMSRSRETFETRPLMECGVIGGCTIVNTERHQFSRLSGFSHDAVNPESDRLEEQA